MSWVKESENPSWIRRLCTKVVTSGPVPKHVAFIMDGNRRFAKKNSIERAQGHVMGFDKLAETLSWCLDIGITEVTVYAFSIENFKRSKEEVDGLLELARQKFQRFVEEKDLIEKKGVRIKVLGNISLLPRDIQEAIAEAELFSKHNTRAYLNVCFAYTSRDEICHAMQEIAEGVQMGIIRESDISEPLIDQCLYTNKSREPDLLVRTSGEVRLSDFLLWQSTFSALSFMPVLWPEFSIWHMYAAVLHYQRNYDAVKAAKESNKFELERLQKESDYNCVMKELEQEKGRGLSADNVKLQSRISQYAEARQRRIETFLTHLNHKETSYLKELHSTSKYKLATASS